MHRVNIEVEFDSDSDEGFSNVEEIEAAAIQKIKAKQYILKLEYLNA